MRALRLLVLLCFPLVCFGQATPAVIADICPGGCSSNPSNLVEWNGKVCFFATSPTAGRELHVYDGTSVNVVADIAVGISDGVRPGSDLTIFNGKRYFAANDTAGATRYYLYSFDGSTTPPQKVLATGVSIPTSGSSGVVGNDLYFAYNDSANRTQFAKYTTSTNNVQVTPHSFG